MRHKFTFDVADVINVASAADVVDVANFANVNEVIDDDCLVQKMLLKSIKIWYSALKKLKNVYSNYLAKTHILDFFTDFDLLKKAVGPKFDMRHVKHLFNLSSSQFSYLSLRQVH